MVERYIAKSVQARIQGGGGGGGGGGNTGHIPPLLSSVRSTYLFAALDVVAY